MSARNVRNLLAAALALSLIGGLDAVIGRVWDLATVFAATSLLLLLALALHPAHRRPLDVRADLATWLAEQSLATGEPVGRLADRALAARRAQLAREPDEPSR